MRGPAVFLLLVASCGSRSDVADLERPPPPSVSYDRSLVVWMRGRAITPLLPRVTGEVTSFDVLPPLPTGIDLDVATGEIAGTPQNIVDPAGIHILTAIGPGGASSMALEAAVLEGFVADTFTDIGEQPSDRGDGFCDTDPGSAGQDNSPCTLRAALEEMNGGSPTRMVVLPTGTYRLTAGELASNSPMVIVGESAVIDGA